MTVLRLLFLSSTALVADEKADKLLLNLAEDFSKRFEMLRSVAILVVIGLASVHAATDKASCAALTDVDLGICGKMSGKTCVPKGTDDAAYVAVAKAGAALMAAMMTDAKCKDEGASSCPAGGPALKSNYCSSSGGFCTTRKAGIAMGMCTADTDCEDDGRLKTAMMKKICCSVYSSGVACDYPSAVLDPLVKAAKEQGLCADSNCVSLRFSVIIPAAAAAFAMIASAC